MMQNSSDLPGLVQGGKALIVAPADDRIGVVVTLDTRAGLLVPGPAWWVVFPDGDRSVYDDDELSPLASDEKAVPPES